MDRRKFIQCSAACVAVCGAMPCAAWAKNLNHLMPMTVGRCGVSTDQRYDTEMLLYYFDNDSAPWYTAFFSRRDGQAFAESLVDDMRTEYENIIPQIPFIGETNFHLRLLIITAQTLALYQALKNRGGDTETIGRLVYEMAEAGASEEPQVMRRINGWLYCKSRLLRRFFKQAAADSATSPYPDDFVFSLIEGRGKDFDWGWDFSQCTIQILCARLGADELTPYLCQTDFAVSAARETGLVRTMTIAEGYATCDFRYKWGRTVDEPY